MYRSRANLGRKRGHRAPAIRPGGTLGLSETADMDARLFQDSTGMISINRMGSVSLSDLCGGKGGVWHVAVFPLPFTFAEPRASRVPSSDEEVVEEPQSRRTRMSLGTKGLKVNLFPGLSPSALKVPISTHTQTSGLPALHPALPPNRPYIHTPHSPFPISSLTVLMRGPAGSLVPCSTLCGVASLVEEGRRKRVFFHLKASGVLVGGGGWA